MTYLFGRGGKPVWEDLDLHRTLLAFDFDGTIAPIAARAGLARTPKGQLQLWRRLVRKADVAVITGRAVRDARSRLGFTPKWLIGNHGLEAPWEKRRQNEARQNTKSWIKQLKAEWPGDLDRKSYIENKNYSLSLHYRGTRDPRGERVRLLKLARGLDPLPRIVPGLMVLNLTLKGGPNKGTSLQKILDTHDYERTLFAGDDDTDDDVFKLRDKRITGIQVGKRAGSKAHYYLRSQDEMTQLLEAFLQRL